MSKSAAAATAAAGLSTQKLEATREWLENQKIEAVELEDDFTDLESVAESSVVESSDCDDNDDTDDSQTDLAETVSTTSLGTQMASLKLSTIEQSIKDVMNSYQSVQTVGNINIENSTGVHIGNITNINGNIQIIHAGLGQPNKQQRSAKRKTTRRSAAEESERRHKPTSERLATAQEEPEERVRRDAFIDRIKFKIPKELCCIIPRRSWLAQLPMEEYNYLQGPAELVVISHTATESSEKQAINIRIIRDIQCFHIESRGWNDIAYNFLVGCDGNMYEGRGWGVVGAHTMGYNTCSIGISFIGCFMRELPAEKALNACKNFLKKGVAEGHLTKDYKVICHCQCRSTESPGRKLFEEIQRWEHFHNIEEEKEAGDGEGEGES